MDRGHLRSAHNMLQEDRFSEKLTLKYIIIRIRNLMTSKFLKYALKKENVKGKKIKIKLKIIKFISKSIRYRQQKHLHKRRHFISFFPSKSFNSKFSKI